MLFATCNIHKPSFILCTESVELQNTLCTVDELGHAGMQEEVSMTLSVRDQAQLEHYCKHATRAG